MRTPSSLVRERERKRERDKERDIVRDKERGRQRQREREIKRERKRERERKRIVIFFKGMTGALAPFSYLVISISSDEIQFDDSCIFVFCLWRLTTELKSIFAKK